MSTTTTTPHLDTLEVSDTRPVSRSTLVKVELRKMVDTRSGKWLLITIGVITVLAVVIFGLAAHDEDKTYGNFMGFTGTPQGFLLPVLGILLVTQEWSQRTGMVTFTLEPNRAKALWAKVSAAVLLGLAAIVLAMVVGALATLVFGGTDGFDDFSGVTFLKFALLQASGVLQGLAFGLLFLNSAAAIVTFFILPTAFSIVANVWSFLSERAAWIDLGTAQGPLFDEGSLSGKEWAQLLVTTVIWVVIPFAVGMWRVLRAEVK